MPGPEGRLADKGHSEGLGRQVKAAWLEIAAEYRPAARAQYVTPITGAEGWFQYTAKHAARGVQHYQRNGKPPGWEKTGKLWNKGGEWPTVEAIKASITLGEFWQVRRSVRRYAIAAARSEALRYERIGQPVKAAGAWRRVGYLRRMFKNPDRVMSSVRGFSDWAPGHVTMRMLEGAGWQGELVAVG